MTADIQNGLLWQILKFYPAIMTAFPNHRQNLKFKKCGYKVSLILLI